VSPLIEPANAEAYNRLGDGLQRLAFRAERRGQLVLAWNYAHLADLAYRCAYIEQLCAARGGG